MDTLNPLFSSPLLSHPFIWFSLIILSSSNLVSLLVFFFLSHLSSLSLLIPQLNVTLQVPEQKEVQHGRRALQQPGLVPDCAPKKHINIINLNEQKKQKQPSKKLCCKTKI